MVTLTCTSPIDGSVVAERAALTEHAARDVASRARTAQADWARRPLADRVALVLAGMERLGALNDEIVPELARMMGRPIRYGGEFGGVRERTEHVAAIAETALTPIPIEDSARFRRVIRREPHGIVLVIAPWNYPYLTAINTVAPALIAGNAVLLKSATQTLLAGERMVEAFTQAGVPGDVFANVFLDHAGTETLVASGAVDFVNFTGSVAGGRAIERAAAGTFTPVGLELGGKDPGYVIEDADLPAAIATLMDAAMYNSGQCCCGIERIYVARPMFDDFVSGAVAEVRKLRLGDPLDPETTLGPMAHARFARAVREQIEAAVAAGAVAHLPRLQADDGGAYLSPQILTGVTHEMAVMREESFGPVVGIMPVDGDDEAVRLMNDSPYGLTASLWTADTDRAEALGARIETGTVFQNRADYLDPALCWTGCKDTGRGGSLGVIGFHNLTRPKSYHLRKATA
jgi:acyl-CoA reductase-like NAD-dependent aldehyde dehydrogenase